ncbi:unnamed protein product [Mytilus coruscus]|uniref:Uncharacterized protein n=1 Tax=Mytilus coruscus TaxID=42192 RepID=A0A6J8A8X0_MYTCO|nr:unnamed protein product [Mytilus coruscus]
MSCQCHFTSSTGCSGNIVSLNACANRDITTIFTENGLHSTKFNIQNVAICTENFNHFLKLNVNRSKRTVCQPPPVLSYHPGLNYKSSRSVRICDVEMILSSSGIIIPVGTHNPSLIDLEVQTVEDTTTTDKQSKDKRQQFLQINKEGTVDAQMFDKEASVTTDTQTSCSQVHIEEESTVADHCRKFAMSDAKSLEFQEQCTHIHDHIYVSKTVVGEKHIEIDSHLIPTIMIKEDSCETQLHSLNQHSNTSSRKETSDGTFSCQSEECILFFPTNESMEGHVLIGDCQLTIPDR